MELWIWTFAGGLAGTFIMDMGARRFVKAGVNDALGGLLGRWVIGFLSFKCFIAGHRELLTPETPQEKRVGIVFHYIVGGGGVALIYPAWFICTEFALPDNHIVPGFIFGLISVGLTWFLQYPCFGFGIFGRKGPKGCKTILPPLCLHTLYGGVVGIILQFRV